MMATHMELELAYLTTFMPMINDGYTYGIGMIKRIVGWQIDLIVPGMYGMIIARVSL